MFAFVPWMHHVMIIQKAKSIEEALFYIRKTIEGNLSRDALDNIIRADLYHTSGIRDKDALAEFLKKNDVEGTVEDFGKALRAITEGADGEISIEEAEAVAGGAWWGPFVSMWKFLFW
ncbi:MAG: DUF1016 N-terminal domain-containing protein, partial [Lachnospiraceae bacterium]|nr:DUF1016 N-terminal domain-containing protein [Lachnospiraceae bacterium]